ncbi:MAG TPA: hypothetical protein DD435_08900 [Cyanobacteria bacterium UBA8530]|nr:hypothetical protein [Cyanobacteria bacterium UBA8530]
MKDKSNPAAHGNHPTQRKLAERLQSNLALWNEICLMASEIGATWRWMYSDRTEQWSFRAYLPGDRFFTSLSLTDSDFEVSLNLKFEEWDALYLPTPEMEARLAEPRAKAAESGEAWIYLPVKEKSDIPLVASLFAARSRRQQTPKSSRRGR